MANSISAYTPVIWAQMGIAILAENIVMPKLVRRDFSPLVAQAGDTVNTRKPAKMTATDVDATLGVTVQDVSSINVAVTLDQHKNATFKIYDREASRSFENLVDEFMKPATLSISNAIDKSCLALFTDIPTIIDVTSAGNWKTAINTARTRLNKLLAPPDPRYGVVSDDDDGALSNLDNILKANEAGSAAALREGVVGRLKGFNMARSSNIINVGSPGVRHNLFFHQDAFALVSRVLSPATGSTPGANQMSIQDPVTGLALRVTIHYNATLLSTQITVDTLYGVKTLDSSLAVVLRSGF